MEKENREPEIDWRKFYRNVIALVVPMALQNLINVGVTATDVIMLGAVGETAPLPALPLPDRCSIS